MGTVEAFMALYSKKWMRDGHSRGFNEMKCRTQENGTKLILKGTLELKAIRTIRIQYNLCKTLTTFKLPQNT